MDLLHRTKSTDSIASDLKFGNKAKKKGKKTGKKKKKDDEKQQSTASECDKEGLSYYRKYFVSKPECRILFKEISDNFEQWLSWQRKIIICGLTEKCSKSLVRTLGTVVEPIRHGNALALNPSFVKKKSLLYSKNGNYSKPNSISTISPNNVSPVQSNTSYKVLNEQRLHTLGFSNSEQYYNDFTNEREDFSHSSFFPAIETKAQFTSANQQLNLAQLSHKHQDSCSLKYAPSESFFPKILLTKSDELGKLCTPKSIVRINSTFYTSKAFKNRKWWPSSAPQNDFLAPSGKKLLWNFKKRLTVIYEWFGNWSDAEQGDCLLQILSCCEEDELQYFSQCVLQRLKERDDINCLSDKLLLKIFGNLAAEDLLAVGSVCKHWYSLANDQDLWRNKCQIIGQHNGLPGFTQKVESVAKGSSIDWKIMYRDLLLRLQQRKTEITSDESEESESEDDEFNDAVEDNDKSYTIEESTDDEADTASVVDQNEVKSEVKSDAESSEEASSVSGMSEYLNGNLTLIEDTMQQLSSQAKRENSDDEEDTALDIRPDVSMQAHNKILDAVMSADDMPYKFVNLEGIGSLKRVRKLQGHIDAVSSVCFDKKRVISGSADRTIRVWDVRSGRIVRKLKGHKGGVRAICLDKDHIISASWDTTIFVWSAVKFRRIKTLVGHKDCVSCLDTNEDILVSGSHDKTIKVWDKITWSCVSTLYGHQGCVTSVCLLENNTALSGSTDWTVRHWDVASGSCLRSFHGSKEVILTVKCCGDLVAGGAQDGNLLFWDIKTGKCEAIILAHNGPLHSVSFSGARFVTAGGDQLVKEWDLSTCCCLRSLTGHKNVVLCVQASKRRIVSGSADGTVRIWDFGNHVQQVM
ncbi:uncharacterized protein LOC135683825 isoform X1 [Rhopilema esculentum]|uniref:uncharacterized protein LOC135683825 isoform X1 n=1 Tax=Rhopilema esculentum TaxID=499914 RepID=UPI0031D43AF6